MTRVLLLVSADRRLDEERVARGEAPRKDYAELAEALRADCFDFGQLAERSKLSRGRSRFASGGLLHAWHASRLFADYDVIFSDNERVGVFASILLRGRRVRPKHVVLAHHLTPLKKRLLLPFARRGIDELILHSVAQEDLALDRLGFAPEQVSVLPYQVDTQFWVPLGLPEEEIISSVGLECRDYETLVKAASTLPVAVKVGAASHWSSKRNYLAGRDLPSNVEVRSYEYLALRELYDRSRFVVVPLFDVDFQAGITLILEAMSMGKAVVATETRGQAGAVVGPLWTGATSSWPAAGPQPENSTGIYVRPGDVAGLRSVISFLLANPETARILGANGRRLAEQQYSIEAFGRRFADAILGPPQKVLV